MRVETCPTCGHPMPGDDLAAILPPKQRHLYEIVERAGKNGISAVDAMKMLYADEPSGGPEGTNIISVFAHYANVKLKPHGVMLSARRGPWARWRLIKVEDA